jgi:hypothetical protein
MMMFLSGEGGTGKSEVIKLIMEYTRLYFGKTYGLYGPVVALGPTGVAANNVGGFTWQSVCKLSKSSKRKNASLESKLVMGRNIDGVKLIIIDEISMVSCESLHMMSKRFTDARIAAIADPEERKRLEMSVFGGIHVLFVGDFYQLPPIMGTPLYQRRQTSNEAEKGRKIWSNEAKNGRKIWLQIKHFVELDVNYRLQDCDEGTKALASSLKDLRKGIVTEKSLALLNSKALCVDVRRLLAKVDRNSVWLGASIQSVADMNHQVHTFAIKQQKAFEYRCVSSYTPNLGNNIPTLDEICDLHQQPSAVSQKKECLPSYIDIGIGCRVRCVRNIGTQIGIFNGAMGTVVGFCFEKKLPDIHMPLLKDFQAHVGREIPIVLVQMDSLKGFLSKDNVIPFAAQIDESHPLRTNGKIFYRRQLPLEISFASTIHKYQGLTAQHDVIVQPTPNPFAFGLEYVAISRTTSLEKLHLLSPLYPKHFLNKRFLKTFEVIHEEYDRFRLINDESEIVDDSFM